jgi:hypothetical protein
VSRRNLAGWALTAGLHRVESLTRMFVDAPPETMKNMSEFKLNIVGKTSLRKDRAYMATAKSC